MIQVPYFFIYYTEIYEIISLLIDKIINIKQIILGEVVPKEYGKRLTEFSKRIDLLNIPTDFDHYYSMYMLNYGFVDIRKTSGDDEGITVLNGIITR